MCAGVSAEVDGGHGAGHELRADVLDTGASFPDRGEPAEVPAAGERGAFDEFTRGGPDFQGLVQAAEAGQRHQVHYRGGVVGFEEIVDFGGRPAVGHERLPERADDPFGVGVADGRDRGCIGLGR